MSKRGPAVLDAIWSTSVQFGGRTSLILNALSSLQPIDNLTDSQIVACIQDYKIRNNDILFKSSSSSVRKSTLNRAMDEKKDLLNLDNSYLAKKLVVDKLDPEDKAIIEIVDTVLNSFNKIGDK